MMLSREERMGETQTKKVKKEKIPRQVMPEQKPAIRARNFEEVPLGQDSEAAMQEAARCIQCKKPACVTGCPVEVDIPGFIKFVKEGNFTAAINKIWEKIHSRVTRNVLNRFKQLCEWRFQRIQDGRYNRDS